jgi:hypothetical protein
MRIKKIEYLDIPTDLVNDCVDVFVTLEGQDCTDEFCYYVEITTPQFFFSLMERFESDFVPPGYPYIIVSKLTDDIIKAAIQSFMDEENDLYWLKLYHIPATLDIEDLNEILDRKKQENIELDAEVDAEIDAETEGNGRPPFK